MSGTANVNDLALRLGGGPSWAMVRTHFDIQSFGVNAYIAEEPGIRIIDEHDELVPFGGEQAHKAFALAVGLQLLVDSLLGAEAVARDADHRGRAGSAGAAVFNYGAVMLVARPEADPVPALRARAGGARLPGDR